MSQVHHEDKDRLKKEYIKALEETWTHISSQEIEQISKINFGTLFKLYKLFCEQSEIVISYNKEYDVRNIYTNMEDFAISLDEGWILLMKVRSVIDGKTKKLSLATPIPESKKFVMICKNGNPKNHDIFNKMILDMLL